MSVILSQQNHLWSQDKIGSSDLTIGSDGCTTCCLAMINNRFGENCTPDQIASHPGWYTPSGLILWNALHLKATIFDWREYMFDPVKIRQTLLDPERAVMIQVQLPRNQKHWMLVDNEAPGIADIFICDDPWSGKQVNSDHYGSVIGAAYFSKRIPLLP